MDKKFAGRYILDQKQIDEMRMLRARDPEVNTLTALAERYNTTKGNVSKIINRRNRRHRIDIYRDGVNLRGESGL